MILFEEFKKCTIETETETGHKIECKLGLWSAECNLWADTMAEAVHYFSQYKLDGEYSSIIGGKSVTELLK